MQALKIAANYRTDMTKSRLKQLRRDGFVTGTVFGHNAEPISIEVDLKELVAQVKGADSGLMSLIELAVNGGPKGSSGTVIIKTVYKDPLTRRVLDVQFQRVSAKEKVNMSVPIELVGEAAGTREGGIVEQLLDTLDISCLPGDIPSRIEVDVTDLQIGHHIAVGDIPMKEGVEVRIDAGTNVCTCVMPHVSHAAEAAEEEATPAEGASEAASE